MIHKEEIFVRAKEKNLYPTTIEKDYVLSWMLWGIASHPVLSQMLIFKGGTCIKKCYFGVYRFSEDLDFTLNANRPLSCKSINGFFLEACDWVHANSGIEFLKKYHVFEEYQTPRGSFAIQGRLRYRGPLQHKTSFPKIKIDITPHELLVEKPVRKEIIHHYSDQADENKQIKTYAFEELFAEKIRALFQRSRPRDLYDVVRLNTQNHLHFDKTLVKSILKKKCEFVKIPYPSLSLLQNPMHVELLSSGWKNMLAHQISELEPVEHYWGQLSALFEWV